MSFKQLVELADMLDDGHVTGGDVVRYVQAQGAVEGSSTTVKGERGSTDFVKFLIPGKNGKRHGGSAPTFGIVGRLGGLGARPERLGFTSDGDGALAAVTCAATLARGLNKGDQLEGDVIVGTHICPHAPTLPHKPVPFMDSPVTMDVLNQFEIDPAMDAILSIDTTKGNQIICKSGISISPTVLKGYILRVSEDLLNLMAITTGKLPAAFPITQQDITPYGNGLYHMNSILQPSVAADVPVVGLAITTETMVPGCATGATHLVDVDDAVRYSVEVAKAFTQGVCSFYDRAEYERMENLYGSMSRFQTNGNLK